MSVTSSRRRQAVPGDATTGGAVFKDAIRQIVGKRIVGVVVKSSTRLPQGQVFLLLEGGMYYEIFALQGLQGGGSVYPGDIDDVRKYLAGPDRQIVIEELLNPDSP